MTTNAVSTLDTTALEESLLDFIRRELLGPNTPLDRGSDLLSGDLLDSVAVLRLASFVAEEHRIQIQPTDFVVENFQNVEVLAVFVRRSVEASAATDSEG